MSISSESNLTPVTVSCQHVNSEDKCQQDIGGFQLKESVKFGYTVERLSQNSPDSAKSSEASPPVAAEEFNRLSSDLSSDHKSDLYRPEDNQSQFNGIQNQWKIIQDLAGILKPNLLCPGDIGSLPSSPNSLLSLPELPPMCSKIMSTKAFHEALKQLTLNKQEVSMLHPDLMPNTNENSPLFEDQERCLKDKNSSSNTSSNEQKTEEKSDQLRQNSKNQGNLLPPPETTKFLSSLMDGEGKIGMGSQDLLENWREFQQAAVANNIDPNALINQSRNQEQETNSRLSKKAATRETTTMLKSWLNEHRKNPYPTKGEKIMLAVITRMNLTQVSTWFANARRRLKKENKMTWNPRSRHEMSSASISNSSLIDCQAMETKEQSLTGEEPTMFINDSNSTHHFNENNQNLLDNFFNKMKEETQKTAQTNITNYAPFVDFCKAFKSLHKSQLEIPTTNDANNNHSINIPANLNVLKQTELFNRMNLGFPHLPDINESLLGKNSGIRINNGRDMDFAQVTQGFPMNGDHKVPFSGELEDLQYVMSKYPVGQKRSPFYDSNELDEELPKRPKIWSIIDQTKERSKKLHC